MKTLILLTIALMLTLACGTTDQPPEQGDITTNPIQEQPAPQAETSQQASTQAITPPTRPARLTELIQPEQPERVSLPALQHQTAEPTRAPTPQQAGEVPESRTKAQMPAAPQFNDEVLLQDIYNGMNLEQYALNSEEPIPYDRMEANWIEFEPTRDHPYLHMFPHLQKEIMKLQAQADKTAGRPRKSSTTSSTPTQRGSEDITNHTNPDTGQNTF